MFQSFRNPASWMVFIKKTFNDKRFKPVAPAVF